MKSSSCSPSKVASSSCSASSSKPTSLVSSSVHQRLSILTSSSGSGSSSSTTMSKPFIKSKSQTTSSIVFPSFRFSPESEEMQEIVSRPEYQEDEAGHRDDGDSGGVVGAGDHRTADSNSSSPPTSPVLPPQQSSSGSSSKPTGGDISPLKEYILKHKWANKWEKRSLSLDLDLKGKIITAIEDKRRSFVSHFYNEDDEATNNSATTTAPHTEPSAASSLNLKSSSSKPGGVGVRVAGPGPHHTPTSFITIDRSTSIPEELVTAGISTTSEDNLIVDFEDSSVHSDPVNSSSRPPAKHKLINLFEENNTDYFEDEDFEYLVNTTPASDPKNSASPDPLTCDLLRDLVVEEIGVDCVNQMASMTSSPTYPDNLSLLREFVLPPDALVESFQGLPTLYNPPNVVKNLRRYPIQEAASTAAGPPPSSDILPSREDSNESIRYNTQSGGFSSDSQRQLARTTTFRYLVRSVVYDIAFHPWVKYWVAVIASLIILDFGPFLSGLLCFLLGAGTILILNSALGIGPLTSSYPDGTDSDETLGLRSADSLPNLSLQSLEYSRSQGWMLTFPVDSVAYPTYDAFRYHLRTTKPVFVRLDGPVLVMSFPHHKHRIPKRRLWSDPVIATDHIFVRHQQFNIYGARIEIVPIGLARKRVWCKKYPISITITSTDKFCGKLLATGLPGQSSGGTPGEDSIDESGSAIARDTITSSSTKSTTGASTAAAVSYSKGDQGVKVDGGAISGKEKYKGEVYREEGSCAGKTIYLFARTDREKDDWYRRLVVASKTRPPVPQMSVYPSTTTVRFNVSHQSQNQQQQQQQQPSPAEYSDFISYMLQACPTLTIHKHALRNTASSRSTPTNELFESVSIHNLNNPSSITPPLTSSPLSSRKSTPEKMLYSLSHELQSQSPTFLNALIARLFFDFLHSEKWAAEVRSLIDRKLHFMRKPPFVQSLKVKELDLGDSLPVIMSASPPVLDKQGLWVDMDVRYAGGMVITIEAFVNFMLTSTSSNHSNQTIDKDAAGTGKNAQSSPSSSPQHQRQDGGRHAMFDSEADDSGESSESDDEQDGGGVQSADNDNEDTNKDSSHHEHGPQHNRQHHHSKHTQGSGLAAGKSSSSVPASSQGSSQPHHQQQGSSTQQQPDNRGKLLKYADSFAKSSVMRNKHVQKLVGGISATPLLLTVEVKRVIGPLAVNIPPVPNDRVWVGFRGNPIIDINAKPKVGERFIGFSQATRWIRKKLLLEFQRVMVLPNMVDVTVPILEYDLPK